VRERNLLIALGIYFHFYAPTDLFYILTHQEKSEREGKLNNGDLLFSSSSSFSLSLFLPLTSQQQPC
jgi:hypothetical protein